MLGNFLQKIIVNIKKHKRRLFWLIGAGLFFILLCGVVWSVVSPYNHRIDKTATFYIPDKPVSSTVTRATVVSVKENKATVRLEDGMRKDDLVDVGLVGLKPQVGDRVVLDVKKSNGPAKYVTDYWRIPGVVVLFCVFIWLVIAVGGKQGVMSVLGLVISIGVITFALIPSVINGANAFWACVVAAFIIAGLSIITAHGWRWRTVVSLLSIFLILSLTVGLSLIGGWLGGLTGVYDDTSAILQVMNSSIDMRGVLVGGIIIATLGVLDDIVTAQTAAIDELHKAQPRMGFKKLFAHGHSVGREHVAALVNTLALAYIGVSLPVVLSIILSFDASSRSVLMLFNSEFISQEVVRTLVSSIALVIAVPASTVVASMLILHKKKIFATLKRRGKKSGGHNATN